VRKLHLVGYTPDLEGLIFTARRGSRSGGYVVAIEDALVDTIDEARRRRNGDTGPAELARPAAGDAARPARVESTLTPREIQARLRSGRSIAQVAAEARVDLDWVERFAVPILAEQAQMVELARAATYSKPRLGPSAEPLGASVAWNLADRGVQLPDDATIVAWTAHQVHDAVWRVSLGYRSRGRGQEAAWELDAESGLLTARNRLASELGHVEKGRKRRVPSRLSAGAGAEGGASDGAEPEAPPARRRRVKATTRRTARRSTAAAKKAPASKAAANKASVNKASANKASANKASGRKALAKKALARKASAKKAPAKKAPAKKASAKRAPAQTAPATKAPAKRARARKAPATKASARKSPARKALATRTLAAKKASARKASAKRAQPAGKRTAAGPTATRATKATKANRAAKGRAPRAATSTR
jgi:hypothetical protein